MTTYIPAKIKRQVLAHDFTVVFPSVGVMLASSILWRWNREGYIAISTSSIPDGHVAIAAGLNDNQYMLIERPEKV